MAWLHTAPSVKDKETEPRINTLPDESPFKALPPIEQGEDIAQHFDRLGCVNQGGMGISPLNWGDVRDYCLQYGVQLTGWESEQLILMSGAYAASMQKAKDKNQPAPYGDESKMDAWREHVSKGTKAAFGKNTQERT